MIFKRARDLEKVVNLCLSPFNRHAFFEQKTLANYQLLRDGLKTSSNGTGGGEHERVVHRVLASYRAAKLAQKNAPDVYNPGKAWEYEIQVYRKSYFDALNADDATALGELLKDFFRNSGTAGIWTFADYASLQASGPWRKKWFINSLLKDYLMWKEIVDAPDLARLEAPRVGNPWGIRLSGHLIMPVSFRHDYFAQKVKALLSDQESRVVAEIGGGFGGFAYFLLKGDSQTHYIDFDLPEILLMASYYLLSAFPEKKVLLFGEQGSAELSPETIRNYDIILLPHFQLPKLPAASVDLFLNTNSLSEMDYATVQEYISHIARACRRYFLHENSDRKTTIEGQHVEIPSSEFPIPASLFRKLYKFNSLWGGGSGRYKEYLYEAKRIK